MRELRHEPPWSEEVKRYTGQGKYDGGDCQKDVKRLHEDIILPAPCYLASPDEAPCPRSQLTKVALAWDNQSGPLHLEDVPSNVARHQQAEGHHACDVYVDEETEVGVKRKADCHGGRLKHDRI